jgi:phage gp46-like protein
MAALYERTINTDQWLRGLIINILHTRARTDLKCPAPSAIYGHWSESYRNDGLYIGSRLWNAAAKPYRSVVDAIRSIEAAIKSDMSKLVVLGLADEVEVEARDRNHNSAIVTITVITSQKRHVLNLSGNFAAGEWMWQ